MQRRKTKVVRALSISMPYREPQTVTEITQSLELLQAQLACMIDSLGSDHVIEDGKFTDVRIVTLKNCKGDISTNIALLNIFVAKENGGINEQQWLKLLGIYSRGLPLQEIENTIRLYLQISLVVMFQFRIEAMITAILAKLDEKKARDGYYNKVESLLNILELECKETKLKKLNVLAFMRNSLHSGGVTNRYELDVTIDGFRFHFPKGKKVKYFGWGHITLAVESALIIINEILHSEKVKALEEPISAMYIEPDRKQDRETSCYGEKK